LTFVQKNYKFAFFQIQYSVIMPPTGVYTMLNADAQLHTNLPLSIGMKIISEFRQLWQSGVHKLCCWKLWL